MKHLILFLSCTLMFVGHVSSQGNVEVDGAIKIASSDIVDPPAGTIRFNSSTSDFEGWNGFAWISLTGKIQTGVVTDIDGNSYQTRIIGGREWMIENLRTSKYQNGVSIPDIVSNTIWMNASGGAWCWYDNINSNEIPYGKLYNWFAVADNQGLCPSGWGVPGDEDWNRLTDFLGGVLAGGKLKETGFGHWNIPNTGATNESGFRALPGGYRNSGGTSLDQKNLGFWWSSSPSIENSSNAGSRFLSHNQAIEGVTSNNKKFGFSVRCIRTPEN